MTDDKLRAQAEALRLNRLCRFYLTQCVGIIYALILLWLGYIFLYGEQFGARADEVISRAGDGLRIAGILYLIYSLCRINRGRCFRRFIYAAVIYLTAAAVCFFRHEGNVWLAAFTALLFIEGLLAVSKGLAFLSLLKHMNNTYPDPAPPADITPEHLALFTKKSKY